MLVCKALFQIAGDLTYLAEKETFGPNDLGFFKKNFETFGPDGFISYGEILEPGYQSGNRSLGARCCLDSGYSADIEDYPTEVYPCVREYDQVFFAYFLLNGLYGDFVEAMSSSSAAPNSSGIPLQEFRRDCPPGWAPGLPDYPLRLFFDKLKLWYQIFDGADELVGPLVAGRLQGKAQRLALQLRLPRPDGGVDVGSDALVRLSVEEVRDPTNPTIILQNPIPSGIQSLCNSLRDAFGFSDQELVSKSIEDFMEFRRGRMAFSEFSIEFDMRLEEATTRAGFEINDVAKFYLFFKAAQLPAKLVDDIKLQIQGDLRRFQEARALALRLVHRAQEHHDSYFMGDDDDDDWDEHWEDAWLGDSYWQEDYDPWSDEWREEADSWEAPWFDEEYYGEDEYYDAESREPSEQASTPGNSASPPQVTSSSASQAQAPVDENYPMHKGKGRGCSTCGSKWHSAASCPVNGGQGKGSGKGSPGFSGGKGGYGKGYGKPRPSKGSGYGKGKGKKGKSKWSPCRGYGKGYGGHGRKGGHGYGGGSYFGFSEKKLNNSFHGPSSRPSPTKKKHVRFEDENPDTILHLNRPRASMAAESVEGNQEDTAEDQSTQPSIEKRLDFSFALGIFSSLESYHTVKGDKRRGLLVDPGAASGLVGSETLRDLLSVLPQEKQQEVKWNHQKQHNVSGISGNPESTMGEVTIPPTLSGAHGDFRADVLGGDGSLCPALLGNPALRRQRAAILTDYFENGDGVLVVQKPDQERHYLRILLTDSGHYLLPVDEHCDVTEQDASKVSSQLSLFASAIRTRWSDVRHCFLQQSSCSTPERERCELPKGSKQGTSDTSPPTFSTTTSAEKVTCEDRIFHNEEQMQTSCTSMEEATTNASKTSCTSMEEATTNASKTSCTSMEEATTNASKTSCTSVEEPSATSITSQSGVEMTLEGRALAFEVCSSGTSSATFSTTTSGLRHLSYDHCKPFLEDPSDRRGRIASDSWSIEGHFLVRHHRIPRRVLFTPNGSIDCPVDSDQMTGERDTVIRPIPRRAERRLHDDWNQAKVPNRDLGYLWTGITKFLLRSSGKPCTAEQLATTLPTGSDAELFPHYAGDQFPEHWTPERTRKAKQYYRAMPEEFYSQSGRRPITPRNFDAWMKKTRGHNLRLQFQEFCSGSGRLSLLLLAAGFAVAFPVDYRYGWDMALPRHQAMLHECCQEFQTAHLFGAPSCGPWSVSSGSKEVSARESDRRAELPTLSFLHDTFLWQHNVGRAFTLEQPFGSAMFTDSPIARLFDHEGIHKQRLDQCMLGAQDELQQPVRKATAFLSNRRWRTVLKRCGGHKGRAHGVLQGQVNGINRTAMAAVYPRKLCKLFSQDLARLLRQDGLHRCPVWPRSLFWMHGFYYSCERCNLGRACPPGVEHTFVPGECRYGQPRHQPHALPAPRAEARAHAGDMEDPTGPFKFLARSGDYSGVVLDVDSSIELLPESRLYLKAALMQMVEAGLGIFEEATAIDYDHWVDDLVLLRVVQDAFASHFRVLAIMLSLRPWTRRTPDPDLSSACAPLRLLIEGDVRHWRVNAVEDMRLLSHQQLHAPVEEADWHVHLFGHWHDDPEVDRVGAGSSQASRPAAPYVPAEKKKDGKEAPSSARPSTSSGPPAPVPPREEDQGEAQRQPEEEFKVLRPEPEEDKMKILKPLYDFRKVFQKLKSDLPDTDPVMAKRLLLGLHERFYHAPISDFRNMLIRAGLDGTALKLAEEAIMNCSICRKHVRLPPRPQVKIGSQSSSFNSRVQCDLFQYKETWILLMVDEATRYKAAMAVSSREHNDILQPMLKWWFTIYGPPAQLVLDQESSLMSHQAGKELERFGIERVPKGTTSGPAAAQHTGTGLAERHIGLIEITMAKLDAELDRQGIAIEIDDLCREAATAQNSPLNYGGATPAMCVFGILPRPFFQDDTDHVTAITGALQTDVTPFERAIRVRQLALSMVHQAIAEDRVARANKTRPQQLRLGELKPGVSLIDFYREHQGDVGWRGPAELLRLSQTEGTAIISYQGRPYLVSLRHIRPHAAGVFVTLSQGQKDDLQWFKNIIETLSPYKAVTIGWVPEIKHGCTSWRRSSTTSLSYEEAWKRLVSLAKAISNRNVGGVIMGQGLRTVCPPRGTVGVLLLWKAGHDGYTCHEHNNDDPITMKKITAMTIDEVAFLYLYFVVSVEYEPGPSLKIVPSEGALEPSEPMQVDTQATAPEEHDDTMEVDRDVKRKSPDSRTVVIGPESKRERVIAFLEVLSSSKVTTRTQHNMVNFYWMMMQRLHVKWDFPMTWFMNDNHHVVTQWDEFAWRSEMATSSTKPTSSFLFTWPGKRHQTLYASLLDGEIYKVDDETDNIAESEVYDIWPQVDKADEEEVKQFVDTGSFKKVHVNSISSETVVVDSVWIRKWKRYPDGSRRVKSRLCARGCFDNQRDTLSTRSTTATRLSQRILVSTAVNHDHDVESWDVSGAFLKGLTFEKVRELLASRGITSPVRKVVITAPANVWRHLAKFDASFRVDFECLDEWALLCIKPVYGLNDAPLAWQLCLRGHWEEQGGVPSLLDENYFIWRLQAGDRSSVTTHVDDCGAEGPRKWLDEQYDRLVKKFGKVTRQKLPFTHCGVVYRKVADGICVEQDDFCRKLKMVDIDKSRRDDDDLTPSELTSFRSVLGGLLWLTATRLDLVSDVCILQTMVTKAKISHLKQANAVVRRAQAEIGQGLGLYFRKLRAPLRLACVHDSSAGGNVRHYAQEGIMVLLFEDKLKGYESYEHVIDDHQTHKLGGKCHVLWAHGAKAKRVSYSTSHAETLSAVSGMETSTLVAVRLAELLYTAKPPTIQSLLLLQEGGVPDLPCDGYTDCKDLFELASGSSSVPQDKTQRLYVMSLREARLCGRQRWLILTPTESMVADALTKSMVAPQIMHLLSTGEVQFHNQAEHKMTLRRVPKVLTVTEEHLNRSDKELIRDLRVSTSATAACLLVSRSWCFWMVAAAAITTTTATTSSPSTATTSSPSSATLCPTAAPDDGWMWLVWLSVFIIAAYHGILLFFGWLWKTLTRRPTNREEPDAEPPATPRPPPEPPQAPGPADDELPNGGRLRELNLEAENLRMQLRDLRRERDQLAQLYDQQFDRSARPQRELDAHMATCPLGRSVFVTQSGRCWHCDVSCYHIRRSQYRTYRHCQDCAGR